MGVTAHSAARTGAHQARSAATNPALEFLERAGYVVRGLLYGMMGVLALGLVFTSAGKATDQKGSLVILVSNPFGKPILLAALIGLAAYSVWGFVRAIYDPLGRGDDAGGIIQRLGFAWSGLSYAGLVLFCLQFLTGSTSGGGDTTQQFAARILTAPFGVVLTVAVGLIALAAGIGQFVETYRASFRKDLKREEMSADERKIADGLGRFGMFSRGVTFSLVGWFLIQAGLTHNAGMAHGFGGTFVYLMNQPYGRLLVTVVALGFIALGLHSFACARWMRLMGSNRGRSVA